LSEKKAGSPKVIQMIREITAKTLLQTVRQPDPWFGLKYNFNLYRGCQHQCIYCDSRSECYQIENFSDILVKVNAIELLEKELSKKRVKGTIGTGSMNDPYMPLEASRQLTRQALQVIARHQFPVHIITKGSLVERDLDLLQQINQVYAAVSFTITTADDALARQLEPGAALVSHRFAALEQLARRGIHCGVTMMPILPFLEDNLENITEIVSRAAGCGASYILAGFGVTLRDRQRAYFYAQLDRLFPGVRQKYEQRFGERYQASDPNAARLGQAFQELCARLGLSTSMPKYTPPPAVQPSLF
jgi:DNA repair photolyase